MATSFTFGPVLPAASFISTWRRLSGRAKVSKACVEIPRGKQIRE
jgi:hypothetical protein